MPFHKFSVCPHSLSRKPLPPDKGITNELEAVSNGTLVHALRQLSSLINIANTIFSELSTECQAIHCKTRSLKIRIDNCEEKAQLLNAKKVDVPVGNLDVFSRLQEHYQSSSEPEPTLFTADTRPFCVRQLCAKTAVHPVPLLNFLNHYYAKEEMRLMCLPVISEKNPLLEIEKRKPAHIQLAREWNENDRVHIMKLSDSLEDELYRLPSPEEKQHAISLDFPSSVVSIDVTGSSFTRMASIRRSLIHVDFLIKRKKRRKRRNTICEGSSKELQKIFPNMPCSSKSSQTDNLANSNEVKSSNRLGNSHRKSYRRSLCSSESLYKTVDITVPKGKTETAETSSGKGSGKKGKGRSFIPISTISAAMSVAVKLRDSMARGTKKSGEEAQSSSGNWSASSSTRGSVDSAQHIENNSTSQSSLGKDSLFSDNTPQDSRSHDSPLAGYVSDISAATPSPTKQNKNRWLHLPSREERSRTLTPDNTCSDSASTPRVLSPQTLRRGQPDESPSFDDEESVYSVDTDGYFTSMHTDSGLKNPSPKKPCERRGSHSSVSTLGNISVNSLLSRTAVELHSNSSTLTKTKPGPPAPPPRITSVRRECVHGENSPPESDPEVRERLEKKTKIDSSRYPSMCSVSPESSDEERHYSALLGLAPDLLKERFKVQNNQLEIMRKAELPSTNSFQPLKKSETDINYVPQTAANASKVPMIPLKYAQHITVTPVYRDQRNVSADVHSPSGSLKKNNLVSAGGTGVVKSPGDQQRSATSNSGPVIKAKVIPVISGGTIDNRKNITNSMDSLSNSGKAIAKVTLDPTGKVIFSSNSLGRRRDGHPLNYVYPQSPTKLQERKYATLPSRLTGSSSSLSSIQQNSERLDRKSPTKSYLGSPTSSARKDLSLQFTNRSLSPSPSVISQRTVSKPIERPKTLNRLTQVPKLTSVRTATPTVNRPTTFQLLFPKVLLQSSSTNRSPSPLQQTAHNVPMQTPNCNATVRNLGSSSNAYRTNLQNSGRTGVQQSWQEPPKILSSYLPPNSSKIGNSSESLNSFCSSDSELGPKKPMPNEDLFAAIHSSRKRLTSSVSPDAASNRSISPYRPWTPQPRNELAEKGTLNLRYSSLRLPRDRHSWAEGGKTQQRNTLASDRHGPTKQTSMRDFKLLLMQTRSSSTPTPCSKKTAAELLKATAPPVRSPESPVSLPSSPPSVVQNHSRNDWNGVCTVPLKRGIRGRSSLQSRYDFAYPPIIEDCREENEVFSESSRETSSGMAKAPHKPATSTWV